MFTNHESESESLVWDSNLLALSQKTRDSILFSDSDSRIRSTLFLIEKVRFVTAIGALPLTKSSEVFLGSHKTSGMFISMKNGVILKLQMQQT